MRRDLLHPRGEVACLDPLRRGRQIAERYGDLARGAVGEEGDDAHEGETKKDQNADQRPLRLLDARGRHENGEKAGVLALGADDTEDSVIVPAIRGDVLDQHVVGLRVHLVHAREGRVGPEVDGRRADLPVPDEGEVRIRARLDVLQERGPENVPDLHHSDRILVRVEDHVNRPYHESLRLVEQDPGLLHLGLGQGDELRLQRVGRLFLREADDLSVVVRNDDVVDADPRLQRQEEVGQGITIARLGEVASRRNAGEQRRCSLREIGLVADLVLGDVCEDCGLIGELTEDEAIGLVDRDPDDHHERKDAHQHVSADERPQQTRREDLVHGPS